MPRISAVFPALALLAGLVAGCSSGPAPPPANTAPPADENPLMRRDGVFRQNWAMNPLWEDGLAEVAVYDAERVLEGAPRRFEHTMITVKEEFNQQFNTKTDAGQRPGLFPVMKVNHISQIPTERYPSRFMSSLFFRRDQPVQLHKFVSSSQEWCGTSFQAILNDGLQYQQTYNSYHDGQGTGQRLLPLNVLFEDALPYTLRALRFGPQLQFAARIYAQPPTTGVPRPTLCQAQVQVAEGGPAETNEAAWRVRVVLGPAKTNTYWFAKTYPNVLLRQTTSDGYNLRLKQVRRYAYWSASDSAARPQAAPAGETGR